MRIAFNIQSGQYHIFGPIDLFAAFNNQIPQKLSTTKKARPSDLIRYKKDVEEADKAYFWRFRNNNENEHVSEKNPEKTRLFMGEEAYERCKKENISTQWTDDPTKDNYDNWKSL